MDDLRTVLNVDDDGHGDDLPPNLRSQIDDTSRSQPRKFLGMSAGERAFLSVILFFIVLVMGAALLIATGRIVF